MAEQQNSGKGDTSFITIIIIALIFFGMTVKTTLFFFPDFGITVYDLIRFYTNAVILGFIGVWYVNKKIPLFPWWQVIIRFAIVAPISFVVFSFIFNGFNLNIAIPSGSIITQEFIISNLENVLAFILLPLMLVGNQGGFVEIFKIKVPNTTRIISHIPPILMITLLHVGNYSSLVTSFDNLFVALFINFVLFMFMFVVFDVVGYGASEGIHWSWNAALMTIRGSII